MAATNRYPILLCHGLTGWGDDDKITKYFPYWGPLVKYMEEQGFEYYAPSLGPFNSAWDRTCVLWAYLFGGTVDYGKVHSKKHHHARYGKTFEHGVLEDLGMTEEHKKMIVFGHSFGGPTVRAIGTLFSYGSEAEREGTDPDDLSPLFAGGHGNLIHSITTLSGVDNGTTFASLFGNAGMTVITYLIMMGCVFLGDTPVAKYYNGHLQQFGLQPEPGDIKGWRFRNPLRPKYWKHYRQYDANQDVDNLAKEMEVEIVQERILPLEKVNPDIYYFAQRADATHTTKDGKIRMDVTPDLICYIPGTVTDKWTGTRVENYGVGSDPMWFHTDGFVNVPGQSAPFSQPHTDGDYNTEFKPGIWYNMPIEKGDHVLWNGMFVPAKRQIDLYKHMFDLCWNLPVIDN